MTQFAQKKTVTKNFHIINAEDLRIGNEKMTDRDKLSPKTQNNYMWR